MSMRETESMWRSSVRSLSALISSTSTPVASSMIIEIRVTGSTEVLRALRDGRVPLAAPPSATAGSPPSFSASLSRASDEISTDIDLSGFCGPVPVGHHITNRRSGSRCYAFVGSVRFSSSAASLTSSQLTLPSRARAESTATTDRLGVRVEEPTGRGAGVGEPEAVAAQGRVLARDVGADHAPAPTVAKSDTPTNGPDASSSTSVTYGLRDHAAPGAAARPGPGRGAFAGQLGPRRAPSTGRR
jgi:hypothetical protein